MTDSADRPSNSALRGVTAGAQSEAPEEGGGESLHSTEVSGRTLLEWSEYEGIALWWFVHTDFQRMLTGIRSEEKGAGRARRWGRGTAFSQRGGRLLAGGRLAYRLFALAVGRLLSTRRFPEDRAGATVLIISQNNAWRTVRDPQDGRARPGDAFFHSIIGELEQRGGYRVVTCYPLTGPPESWYDPLPSVRKVLRRCREAEVPHRVFDAYWSFQAWHKARRARRRFRSILANELKLEDLRDRVPGGESGYGEVVGRLDYYFHTVFGRVVSLLEIAGRLLRAERPRVVLLINEYGRFERAIVVAARRQGIPVLALQHGVIHPRHPGYILSPDEVSRTGSVESPYCPLPNRTAVFGPYHKELLTEVSAYPPEGVVVTGQPRYDLLARAADWYRRDDVLEALQVDPAKCVVLWATQTHGLPAEENERNVQAVYDAMAALPEAQLVIKLHPSEDQRAPLYRRGGSQTPVIVDGRGDTFALLYACDVLITHQSTVAMEAVALNRPVIILNLSGEPDPVAYVEEGVAVGVTRQGDLPGVLRDLLEEEVSLAENRKRFVEQYLYKLDGKATERVVRLMDRMIRQAAENASETGPESGPGRD